MPRAARATRGRGPRRATRSSRADRLDRRGRWRRGAGPRDPDRRAPGRRERQGGCAARRRTDRVDGGTARVDVGAVAQGRDVARDDGIERDLAERRVVVEREVGAKPLAQRGRLGCQQLVEVRAARRRARAPGGWPRSRCRYRSARAPSRARVERRDRPGLLRVPRRRGRLRPCRARARPGRARSCRDRRAGARRSRRGCCSLAHRASSRSRLARTGSDRRSPPRARWPRLPRLGR